MQGGCSLNQFMICDDNADCTDNEDGSIVCTCKPEYQGDGLKGDNNTGCRLGIHTNSQISSLEEYTDEL